MKSGTRNTIHGLQEKVKKKTGNHGSESFLSSLIRTRNVNISEESLKNRGTDIISDFTVLLFSFAFIKF